MTRNPITELFYALKRAWRVHRALKAKLPFDNLDRAERTAYLRKLDRKTFHPEGISGIQESQLDQGHPVVYQNEKGDIIELLPDGRERTVSPT